MVIKSSTTTAAAVLLALAALCLCAPSDAISPLRALHQRLQTKRPNGFLGAHSSITERPLTNFETFALQGFMSHAAVDGGEDHFAAVRSVIDKLDYEGILQGKYAEEQVALVETGAQVGKVRSYCEICILVMQMKQRGQPHLCAGLNANYYVTCIENLESLLRADKALVYWLKNGCMHMDSTGPEIVRPCPALSICGWVPNLFAAPPSLVRDGIESLCPKDPKFLPTIPNEYKSLLSPQEHTS
eukprot:TRINITY_DN66392_c9_g1_i3.p1 TRINITY_DN66392_c9_g1~~TRINITY_DN66392_c9_g1_i3.p1  ORF type:complete len:255 (-),score=115.58 TRINITY_DN66392_c9_g1_i3:505-1233(-)